MGLTSDREKGLARRQVAATYIVAGVSRGPAKQRLHCFHAIRGMSTGFVGECFKSGSLLDYHTLLQSVSLDTISSTYIGRDNALHIILSL